MNQHPQLAAAIEKIIAEMSDGERIVPARLQAALALLEKLRRDPVLELTEHMSGEGSSGLKSHETFGKAACDRFNIDPPNKTHGRRSSEIRSWGPRILDALRSTGFEAAAPPQRESMLDAAQTVVADHLRRYAESGPIAVRCRNRSVTAVVAEIIKQAEDKRKSGDVAQYLVGAKLEARFPGIDLKRAANCGDGTWAKDETASLGDFQIGTTVIEIAVGRPDEKHIDQIASIVSTDAFETWLIVRSDRRDAWIRELADAEVDMNRVSLLGINEFIGQNLGEMGRLDRSQAMAEFKKMIDAYNDEWVARFGSTLIRINLID
ncbi:MAG: DUF4928 family protein [Phycisphaerales bacterium]|nr:DUF4928 family protein [Phycisphaerales bacterium]